MLDALQLPLNITSFAGISNIHQVNGITNVFNTIQSVILILV